MGLSSQAIETLQSVLAGADASAATIAELRRQLPGMALSRCDASDVADEAPFLTYDRCKVYLIDGRNHCWAITGDPAAATGLLLAAAETKA